MLRFRRALSYRRKEAKVPLSASVAYPQARLPGYRNKAKKEPVLSLLDKYQNQVFHGCKPATNTKFLRSLSSLLCGKTEGSYQHFGALREQYNRKATDNPIPRFFYRYLRQP